MNAWVLLAIAVIVGSVVYSYWRQMSFSLVVSVACGAVFLITLASIGFNMYDLAYSDTMEDLAFMPDDLTNPSRLYTPLTSMFTHAGFYHLFFNILGLAFIGMMFEQRIGTRQFIVIFFVTGLCGALAFAAVRWNDPYAAVVGASGAIFGVLGAFARLYPNERMSMILFLLPLPAIVGIFLLLQLVFISGEPNVAVESHLAGLFAGVLLAPYIVKMPLHKRVKKMVSKSSLKKLATTPELKTLLRSIEDEEIPDVRSAWIEHFLTKARCPTCGSAIKVSRGTITCEQGHEI